MQDEELWISVHVLCELFAGAELFTPPGSGEGPGSRLRAGLQVAYPDEGFAETYARLLFQLERCGERIATMDLLIAASALRAGAILVSRNEKDFSRVPELRLAAY